MMYYLSLSTSSKWPSKVLSFWWWCLVCLLISCTLIQKASEIKMMTPTTAKKFLIMKDTKRTKTIARINLGITPNVLVNNEAKK